MRQALAPALRSAAPTARPAQPPSGSTALSGEQGVWVGSGVAIAALHVGAVALAVLWSPTPAPTPLPAAAMMIELAPMAAPPRPVSEKAPGVEQQAARPLEKVEEEKPEPVMKKAEVELPKPKPRPKPKPEVKKLEEAPPAPKLVEQTSAPEAAPAPVATKNTAQAPGAVAASASTALPTWQGALLAHLERYKRYPASAQARRQQGVSYVRFALNRDGSVRWSRLERGSGHSRLDDEAVALTERAQPLPTVPPEIPGEPIEIVVPIQFFLK